VGDAPSMPVQTNLCRWGRDPCPRAVEVGEVGTGRLTRSTPVRPTPASSSGPSTRPAGCASPRLSRAINRTGPCTPPLPPSVPSSCSMAEQTRRTHVAKARVRGLTATARTLASGPTQRPVPSRPPCGPDARPELHRRPDPAGPGDQAEWRADCSPHGQDPCPWRPRAHRQGCRPLPVEGEGAPARASTLAGGDSLIFALVGRVGTGKGPDREEPMIVRHRPPCDRTYQW